MAFMTYALVLGPEPQEWTVVRWDWAQSGLPWPREKQSTLCLKLHSVNYQLRSTGQKRILCWAAKEWSIYSPWNFWVRLLRFMFSCSWDSLYVKSDQADWNAAVQARSCWQTVQACQVGSCCWLEVGLLRSKMCEDSVRCKLLFSCPGSLVSECEGRG